MLVRFFRFEKLISDSLSCGCGWTEVIPAATAPCDQLLKKLFFLATAEFALPGNVFSHGLHVLIAMTMDAESYEP